MKKNNIRSGFVSIFFVLSFLILVSIVTSIIFTSIIQTSALVDGAITVARNSYCAESGIAVGKWYIVNNLVASCPAQIGVIAGSHVNIVITGPAPAGEYDIISSMIDDAGGAIVKTITAHCKDNNLVSWQET
jgi:hypothetical protein